MNKIFIGSKSIVEGDTMRRAMLLYIILILMLLTGFVLAEKTVEKENKTGRKTKISITLNMDSTCNPSSKTCGEKGNLPLERFNEINYI